VKALRGQISAQLETAASRVIESYHSFMNDEPEAGDARAFAAHHAACKAALAHLDLLLKLARLAGVEADAAGDEEQMSLLAKARAELGDDEGGDDDDRVGGA
jgi:adenosylmethionine-8-amino-7-oxononanoate aminotransferase